MIPKFRYEIDASDELFLQDIRERALDSVPWEELWYYGPRGRVRAAIGSGSLFPWSWPTDLLAYAISMWQAASACLETGPIEHEFEMERHAEYLWFHRSASGKDVRVTASFSDEGVSLPDSETREVGVVGCEPLFLEARRAAIALGNDMTRLFPAVDENASVRKLFAQVAASSTLIRQRE